MCRDFCRFLKSRNTSFLLAKCFSKMNEVQVHVNSSRMDLAFNYIVKDDVQYRTVNQLDHVDSSVEAEDIKTFALILSVKSPKLAAKKLDYKRGGKDVETYHRLVLCRELLEGKVFYILSANASESCHLFKDPNMQFVGAFVAVFEGSRDKMIHEIPLVVTKTSLIPIVPTFTKMKVNEALRDLALTETITSFLVEVINPVFGRAGIVPTCRSRFCDSRHAVEIACPALCEGKSTNKAITFSFSAPRLQLFNCHYTSEALAEVFIAPRVLSDPEASMIGLRRAVKEVAAHYFDNNVPWVVAGWQKRARGSGDEASSVRRLHVTFVAPKRMLADAPRFDPVVVFHQPPGIAAPNDGIIQAGFIADIQGNDEEEPLD